MLDKQMIIMSVIPTQLKTLRINIKFEEILFHKIRNNENISVKKEINKKYNNITKKCLKN